LIDSRSRANVLPDIRRVNVRETRDLDESSFISSKATMRDLRISDKSRYTFRLNFSPFT
jgi:hypothetical protein